MENYTMVCEYYDIDGKLVEFEIKYQTWSHMVNWVEEIKGDFPQIMIANIYQVNDKNQAIRTLDYYELMAIRGGN